MRKIKKIFLGGTCNGSTWRNEFQRNLRLPYFNPVVEDWTDEVKEIEDFEKERCAISIYVITPLIKGYYSIAELIDDCHNKRKMTYFCFISEDSGASFDDVQLKSFHAIGQLVEQIGGVWAKDLNELTSLLNDLFVLRRKSKSEF